MPRYNLATVIIYKLQALGSVLSAISTAEAAIPPLAPYIVAEGAEGVAYDQLPTPKNSVLNAISSVVTDLDNKIRQVSWQSLQSVIASPTHTAHAEL